MASRVASRSAGTRRSTVNKRRKGPLAFIVPWLRRFGILLLVGVFGVWLGAWLWVSGGFHTANSYIDNKVLELTSGFGFKVENIKVEGRVYSNAES
jgi:hypothetical protein